MINKLKKNKDLTMLNGIYKLSLRDFKMSLRLFAVSRKKIKNKDDYLHIIVTEINRSILDL